MNARQNKKKLKWKISRLESDNKLMRKIIADSPTMQELYDRYNKPANVHHSTMDFQEFRAKRVVPIYMMDEDYIKHIKRALVQDICEAIKDDVSYTVGSEFGNTTITASMFIGRKEENETS